MSATNRGSEREKNDNYSTPEWAIKLLLDNYQIRTNGTILEPSAGCGNIVKVLRETGIKNHITSIELREEERENLKKYSNEVIIENYLNMSQSPYYDVIIGNPPYNQARAFIEKSFEFLSHRGVLIFLLRVSILESQKRFDFWQQHPVNKLYILRDRPKFIKGKSGDNCAYAWFIWENGYKDQEIRVIGG
jgi:hypothetical protein